MSDIEEIIREVDSSMAMEGLPLVDADRERIRKCLSDPASLDRVLHGLLEKHTVPAR